jgi:cell division septum initiation protein DivIVA
MRDDLESIAAKVETVVDDLKAARDSNKDLLKTNKRLEERIAALERDMNSSEKEGQKTAELAAQNKEYKKRFGLLKAKVTSMLAKVEALQ